MNGIATNTNKRYVCIFKSNNLICQPQWTVATSDSRLMNSQSTACTELDVGPFSLPNITQPSYRHTPNPTYRAVYPDPSQPNSPTKMVNVCIFVVI